MINFFKTWLPQIISYAELVSDGRLRQAWENPEQSLTSAYYSGELFEQVFGDLHAETILPEMRQRLHGQPDLIAAVEAFLRSLQRLDAWIEAHVDTAIWGKGKSVPSNVTSIFKSDEWRDTRTDAKIVIAAADRAGFSSADFDPH